jgi:tetratricopeptide (TPR) repeat protein
MSRFGIGVLLLAMGFPSAEAWAQKSARYQQATPTPAPQQHPRQFGPSQRGYGGINYGAYGGHHFNGHHGAHGGHYFNGYPGAHLSSYGYNTYFNYGGFGLDYGFANQGFSPFPSYTPPVPPVIYGFPPVIGYNPLTDPTLNVPRLGGGLGLNTPVETDPLPLVSTPEAKLKSVRAQAQGDNWLRQQEFHKAFDRYKAAVSEAPDRGEAHVRLAVAYAALGHLDLAVRQLKRGIAADPQLTAKAEPLSKIYGEGNSIAQSAMIHKATLWAKDDIRDPDRLFLLGVLLYLQGDERAKILLETGMLIEGGSDHFRSFLLAVENNPLNATEQAAGEAIPALPDVTDPAPAPETPNPELPVIREEVPPLPAPPASAPEDSSESPMSSGPALPSPNR